MNLTHTHARKLGRLFAATGAAAEGADGDRRPPAVVGGSDPVREPV